MAFFRALIVLLVAGAGFFVGASLTSRLGGALAGAVCGWVLATLLTRPLRGARRVQPAPVQFVQEPPRRRGSFIGRVVWSVVSFVGVSGVIGILTYIHNEKDREEARRQRAEQYYQQSQQALKKRLATSASGRVFDARTHAPIGNAAVGYTTVNGQFEVLGRTAPDGFFRIDVPFLDPSFYPLRIVVVAPNSGGIQHQTDTFLRSGQHLENATVYVANQPFRRP